MGMLADFFIASPDEALRYANRNADPDEGEEIERLLNPAQYKGITGLKIGTSADNVASVTAYNRPTVDSVFK